VPSAPLARTSRRTTVGFGLLALSGCTLDSPASQTPTDQPTVLSDEDYDQRLVDEAAAGMAGALATIEKIAARFDLVAGSLAPLVALHQAHLSALGVITPPSVTVPSVSHGAVTALTRLGALEGRLQQQLAAAAENARSGQLARVLAGMSAGVQQHLLALFPRKTPTELAP
jgi:hypothetical protein